MITPKFIGFDVETKSAPEKAALLWTQPEYRIPGNIKDPVKLAAHRATWESTQAELKADAIADGALSPLTGEIVVIGIVNEKAEVSYIEGPELHILRSFWQLVELSENAGTKFVFWSGAGSASKMFDLDFIVTRSRILGVRIPATVRAGRFYTQKFLDLASEFLLYQSDAYLSLTNAAAIFGFFGEGSDVRPKKPDDPIRGENFAAAYADPATKDAALSYLRNDLLITHHLAEKIL